MLAYLQQVTKSVNAPTIMIGEKGSDLIRGLPPLPAAILSDDRNDRRRELA
jgi:hypothetical protein